MSLPMAAQFGAFWDNRCTQHLALWDYYPQRCYGNRLTNAGDKSLYRA